MKECSENILKKYPENYCRKADVFFFFNLIFYFYLFFKFFYFTILYWFCHTLTWIHHGYTWDPWNSITSTSLFVVMLSKAHLTSHSRISGSRWVITPSWLSGLWRSFLYNSVYSCHLFWISSASFRSRPFLSLSSPSLHEMFPWYL